MSKDKYVSVEDRLHPNKLWCIIMPHKWIYTIERRLCERCGRFEFQNNKNKSKWFRAYKQDW